MNIKILMVCELQIVEYPWHPTRYVPTGFTYRVDIPVRDLWNLGIFLHGFIVHDHKGREIPYEYNFDTDYQIHRLEFRC